MQKDVFSDFEVKDFSERSKKTERNRDKEIAFELTKIYFKSYKNSICDPLTVLKGYWRELAMME